MKRIILLLQFILLPFLIIQCFSHINEYGLHSYQYVHSYNSLHSLSLCISANFYYGDIETPLSKHHYTNLKFDWTKQLAGTCILSYAFKFSTYIGYKAQLGVGAIRGQTEFLKETTLTQRRFNNTYMLYDMGIEIYPFKEGFYIFVGIGGISCIKGSYELNWYNESAKDYGNLNGNTVPVIPIAVGYKYNFPEGIQIGFELSWYPSLIDNYKHNLDGYPGLKYPNDYKSNSFTDGIFNFGIFVGYIFQK